MYNSMLTFLRVKKCKIVMHLQDNEVYISIYYIII